MKRFGAVIFDMDGLLLDTERLALESFNRVCDHLGLGDQKHVFVRCIGTNQAAGWQALEDGLKGKVDIATFASTWDDLHAQTTAERPPPLKDGVFELLDELAAIGLPCAVATSTSTERANRKLRQARLLERFAAVVGGDQVERSKPHPDIYLRAAATIGQKPEHCLALEDSENGVRAAVSAGMTVVQIPDLLQPSPELRALGHIVLDSLHAVRTYRF
jgi:HAD superfamily hydrolase (TIGR01509 family)